MKNYLINNRMGALMTIVVLAIGSISIVGIGISHMAMASQIGKLCVFFACGNATINGGTSGGGGGGQPTPNTATLIVTKEVVSGLMCGAVPCKPSDFKITISGVTASPSSFQGDAAGTTVTVSPGTYTLVESSPLQTSPSFSGDCHKTNDFTAQANSPISAGETQKCTITNGVKPP